MTTLTVTGASTLATVTATGLTVNGNTHITGTGLIDGATSIRGALVVTGTSNLIGNASTTGTFAVNGSRLAVAAMLATAEQGAITVSYGSTITPTGTLQRITASGAITNAVLSAAVNGDIVVLVNTGSQSITIPEVTGLVSAGDIALGAGDTAVLIGTTTTWYELARSNN
jgi:hypothetical protein